MSIQLFIPFQNKTTFQAKPELFILKHNFRP